MALVASLTAWDASSTSTAGTKRDEELAKVTSSLLMSVYANLSRGIEPGEGIPSTERRRKFSLAQ